MARGAALTTSTQADNIDVVGAAAGIAANSYFQSAFLQIAASSSGDRKRFYVVEGPMTFEAQASEGVANEETQYVPTSHTVTCAVNVCDAVLTQEALKDGRTSGKSLQEQVISSGTQAYVSFVDAQYAALYAKVEDTGTDHVIGSSSSALSAALIDDAINLMLTQGHKTPYALVIKTSLLPQLFQIPGMQDYRVKGADGPGGISDMMIANSPRVIAGYGGVLDIYHSPEIDTSSGTHNLMVAVGNSPEHRSLVNPWTPVETDRGVSGQKLLVDPYWNSAERSLDINMTTIEAFKLRDTDTAAASTYAVDIVTSPAS